MNYDNNLSGALFKNQKKQTDKHPDYNGSCEIEGTEYWVSAWVNKSSKGVSYMSLKFNPKDGAPKKEQAPVDDDFADDVPF